MKNPLVNCAILTLIGSILAATSAAQPNTTGNAPNEAQAAAASAAPAESKGCIGRPLATCLATLRSGFEFPDPDTIEAWIIANDEVDVNGKPIDQSPSLSLSGHFKAFIEDGKVQTIDVDYSRSKVVSSVLVHLRADPAIAETESGYRNTGLYEAMALVLGDDCPAIDRTDVYRFFQNIVKPRIRYDDDDIEVDMTNASWTRSHHAKGLFYCGRRFEYVASYGTDTDAITLENEHGFSSLIFIVLSAKGATESTSRKPRHAHRKHP